jgi:hypothetical protein
MLVPIAGLLVAACAAEEQREQERGPPNLGPSWVELGLGTDTFLSGESMGEVPVVLGPQGGYMVALCLQAGGVLAGDPTDPSHPNNPRSTFQASRDGELLGSTTVAMGLHQRHDGDLELLGSWLIFNPALPTSTYLDQELWVTVHIADVYGNEAEDGVTLRAVAP